MSTNVRAQFGTISVSVIPSFLVSVCAVHQGRAAFLHKINLFNLPFPFSSSLRHHIGHVTLSPTRAEDAHVDHRLVPLRPCTYRAEGHPRPTGICSRSGVTQCETAENVSAQIARVYPIGTRTQTGEARSARQQRMVFPFPPHPCVVSCFFR